VIRRAKQGCGESGSPDQFRLNRLKEGERVCGGRGQFGNKPLWDLNAIPNARMACGSAQVCKSDPVGKSFGDGMHSARRKRVS
jgi:hypothetical protein